MLLPESPGEEPQDCKPLHSAQLRNLIKSIPEDEYPVTHAHVKDQVLGHFFNTGRDESGNPVESHKPPKRQRVFVTTPTPLRGHVGLALAAASI